MLNYEIDSQRSNINFKLDIVRPIQYIFLAQIWFGECN